MRDCRNTILMIMYPDERIDDEIHHNGSAMEQPNMTGT